ncbi:hypothetical protein [Pontibacter sp. SGAir0037]|uniref:hypothetical protein n=1 Tax=Pontibacter sp. SGAir0037 TaxID=2571030 RepID=UPI0010CD3BAE|nr:hypothetical protein [Pontibacter sp. SGAir0037]QCR22621.1 hypothetical protein C1N53_09900 [Pontibacter sp. SGAir0037]
MRNEQNNSRDNRYDEREPRWLHEQRHGERSSRGNYRTNTHFNAGYDIGSNDPTSFNTSEDHSYTSQQGRFQPGGATYSGDDYTRNSRSQSDNMYGMSYVPNDDRNSSRHYDPRADYSNSDYDDMRQKGRSHDRYGMPDERFGHDVSRRGNQQDPYLGRSSRGDYESYRRYEQGNSMYDNDYSTGFAGRNHTEGRDHFGEDRYYSNLDRWNGETRRRDRYDNDRNSR